MNIIIFGGSGLIGQALVKALQSRHQVTVVGRSKAKLTKIFADTCSCLSWDEVDANTLKNYEVAINLAGENIGAKRWSNSQKQKIIDSRVNTTALLAEYCVTLGPKAPRLMNASAMGIHGLGFLAEVGAAWEKALMPAEAAGVNVIKLRFAVVLAKQGGALSKMLPSFKLGLGAVLGSGEQAFSWVALEDVVAAIIFLMEHPEAQGPFNIVADEIISQKQFSKTLANSLHRPCFLNMPAPVVKLLFGQMGEELLLNGQRGEAKRLKEMGFEFKYKDLEAALAKIFK